MDKRTIIQGGFALPGLAKDAGNTFGFRRRTSRRTEEGTPLETSKTSKTSTSQSIKHKKPININYNDDATSLVDASGELLSPKVSERLEHLTKSRPRSPGRRNLSPGQRNGERSRSRSPARNDPEDDSFDYGLGLTELDYGTAVDRAKFLTEGSQTSSKETRSPKFARIGTSSSSNNEVTAGDVDLSNNIENVLTSQPNQNFELFDTEARFPKSVMEASLVSQGRENLAKTGFDSDQDDEIGDMLMGDYEDSDSNSDTEVTPLPASPPPFDEELENVNIEKGSRTFNQEYSKETGPKTNRDFTSHAPHDSAESKQTLPLSTKKYFPSIGGFDKHASLQDRNTSSYESNRDNERLINASERHAFDISDIVPRNNNKSEISSHRPNISSTYGTRGSKFGDNPLSNRRRRFKPVSLDLQSDDNTDSDKLLQTLPNSGPVGVVPASDNLNQTFPRTSSVKSEFGGSYQKRRDVDWGLNSSFSESSFQSGTMFDKYLLKKEQRKRIREEEVARQQEMSQKQTSLASTTPLKNNENQACPTGNSDYNNSQVERNDTSHDLHLEYERSDISNKAQEPEVTREANNQFLNAELDDENNKDMTLDDVTDDDDDNESDLENSVDNPTPCVPSFDNHNHDRDTKADDDDSNDDAKGINDVLFDDDNNLIDDIDEIHIHNPPRVQAKTAPELETGNTISGYPKNRIPNFTESGHSQNDYSPGQVYSSPGLILGRHSDYDRSYDQYDGDDDADSNDDRHDYDDNKHGYDDTRHDYDDDRHDYDDDNSDYGNANRSSDEGSNIGDYIDNTLVKDVTDYDRDNELDPPEQYGVRPDTSADPEESLFQPPSMFASDDEELEDDVPPLIMKAEIPEYQKPKKMMPFHKIPLGDWTEEDAREWLDYVGLGHFKEQFKVHHVNGKTLKNINFQLLEEIGINSPDEREIVLSEIYELDNPSEEEQLESEIQDALETASEQDKEKILAVLSALRSPALSSGVNLTAPSTASSSPRDSDAGYHLSSDTTSLASSVTASDDLSQRGSAEVTPSQSMMHLPQAYQQAHEKPLYLPSKGKEKYSKLPGKDGTKEDKKAKDKKKKNKKEKRRISKFWESLSISHTSSKLNKLFGSKKLNPTMQYLLQAGPQGILRVWPVALTGQTKYCSFMVSMTTTSAQVVRMVIEEKFGVVADPLRYYLCEVGTGKRGVSRALEDTDCPLLLQCRWPDPEKYHFELRCLDEGVVRMLFEMEGYEEDLDYRSIGVSSRTPCKDVLPLIVRKYDLPGTAEDYQLMEVSEENEDVRQVVADQVCPLKLQNAWNEPDHVFRLIRVRSPTVNQPRVPSPGVEDHQPRDLLHSSEVPHSDDPYPSEVPPINVKFSSSHEYPADIPAVNGKYSAGTSSELSYQTEGYEYPPDIPPINVKYSAGTSSEASSLRGGYETDSTDHLDHTSEENLTFQALPEDSKVLDKVVMEVQDQLTAPEGNRTRGQSSSTEGQLAELREAKAEVLSKEREVAVLKEQNAELLEKEKELEIWRMRNQELVAREEEVEAFKIEQENILKQLQEVRDSEASELQIRDREIERLYAKNKEFAEKERQYEEMKTKIRDFTQMEETLEHLERANREASAKQNELTNERDDLQRLYQDLVEQIRELNTERVKDSCRDSEVEELKEQLMVLDEERNGALRKVEELQRRNVLLERSAQLLESMRRENEALAAKVKDSEAMKKNIIKLTGQLREADQARLNQGELDDLKLSLGICQAEKQQLQTRVDELERANAGLRETAKDAQRMRKENATLRTQAEEFKDIRRTVADLKVELNEAEALREKFVKLQDMEKSLRGDVQAKDGVINQKNRRVEDLERKLTKTTNELAKLKRESEVQKEQRENLNRLLTIIKERDPSLLKTLHRSLTDSNQAAEEEEEEEEEEWC